MSQATSATDIAPQTPDCDGCSTVAATRHREERGYRVELMTIARVVAVALGAAVTWFGPPIAAVMAVGWAALAFGGWPIFMEALHNLRQRRMTMELSMTIAIIAAAAISEVFTALVITFFVLVAEELEHMTVDRGRHAIADLLDFLPREATVRRGGELMTVPLGSIVTGDTVLVAPGENIPVDGSVISGHSYVDQSRITGESMPMKKEAGSIVYAGSVNQAGALDIVVEKVGRDTSFGRIIDAVENAEQSRAPVQRLADRMAGYLVYFSFAAAIITYLITRDVRDTISVIIVAGACGVAAGTPLAILGGIGRSAQRGAIIKGGLHLETLGRLDTVVLDKTGTLTFGEPQMVGLAAAAGIDDDELLRLAASAELHSEHPLATAIVKAAKERGLTLSEPDSFTYAIGKGIHAEIEGASVHVGSRKLLAKEGIAMVDLPALGATSELFVARNGVLIGAIGVADKVRPEAKNSIAALKAMGIRPILLTGDAKAVAQAVGEDLGIEEIGSEMLPEDKLTRVRALVGEGRIVGMMGDGINDAPALSAASVGIAMGSGTDVAKESADVVLLANDLSKFVETMRIAGKTRSVIWQNFAGTIIVDTIGIVLAAFGYLNPLLAAFIHVSSELVFILNSARLLPAAERAMVARKPAPAE